VCTIGRSSPLFKSDINTSLSGNLDEFIILDEVTLSDEVTSYVSSYTVTAEGRT
jgi:hypothetical protein